MELNSDNVGGRKRLRKLGAFSLIEVLIAIMITAIIFAAFFAGVSATYSMINTSRNNLRATQIMLSKIEALRLCAWDSGQLFNPAIVPPTFTETFYPLGLFGTTNKGIIYNGKMTVETNITLTPPATYKSDLARVTISVTWQDGSYNVTNTHTRSLSTLVSQHGVQNYVFSH